MLAGHYATALLAKQRVPAGHIAYFLVASQLPDLLWQGFHPLGIEPTSPTNPMLVSLDNIEVHMTYSHDLLPTLGWIVLAALVGRVLSSNWRVGLAGGALVAAHILTDYVGGYPHHVFGPDSTLVGTGMYYSAPYLAVALEAVFTAIVMATVVWTDARAGIRRSLGTWLTWAVVFGGGVGFMFLSADLSMVELTGMAVQPALDGIAMPFMASFYVLMIAALVWADGRPREVVASSGAQPST